jgi:hypothetical protein
MPAPFDFDDDDAVEQALEEQLRAFRAKFGRDPGPAGPGPQSGVGQRWLT